MSQSSNQPSKVQLNPNYANGPAVDFYIVTTGAGQVLRQSVVGADPADPNALANVTASDPSAGAYGTVVRDPTLLEIAQLLYDIRLELRFLRAFVTDSEDLQSDSTEGE